MSQTHVKGNELMVGDFVTLLRRTPDDFILDIQGTIEEIHKTPDLVSIKLRGLRQFIELDDWTEAGLADG